MEMIHSHKAGTMHPLLGHVFGTRESEATCNSTDLTGHVLQVPPAPTPTTFPMLKVPTQNSISVCLGSSSSSGHYHSCPTLLPPDHTWYCWHSFCVPIS